MYVQYLEQINFINKDRPVAFILKTKKFKKGKKSIFNAFRSIY